MITKVVFIFPKKRGTSRVLFIFLYRRGKSRVSFVFWEKRGKIKVYTFPKNLKHFNAQWNENLSIE